MQATDAHDGDAHGAADPRELVLGDIDRVRLGGRGDERPDAEVVRTGFLGGTGLLDCLGRDADDGIRSQDAARLGAGGVALSHVHAVCARELRGLDIVVDEEGNSVGAADGNDGLGKPNDFLGRGVLLAQLHEGRAVFNRLLYTLGERALAEPGAVGYGVEVHAAADIFRRPWTARTGGLCGAFGAMSQNRPVPY